MFWGKIKEISRVVREVEIGEIRVPDGRFRRIRCDESLAALAESIREHGVIEPLIVRRVLGIGGEAKFTLVAGERRLRAAEMAGLTTVPVVSVEAGEVDAAILAIIENLHREDLSMFEEAASIQSLISLTGMTQEACAKKLSVSQSYVANKLRLLRLSDGEQEKIEENGLTERHARALLRLEDKEEREEVLLARMAECGLKEEDYWWYVNLRRYGGTKHAGYGLGFERIIMYLTGVANIRDVIPYPRTVGNAEY